MDTIADRSSRFSEADVPGLDIPAEVNHVVFDWNGTLLHDASVIAMCDTEVGRRLGLWDREIDEALLREYSQRHWREGYEWLAGRALADAEVAQMDTVFHEAYVAFRHHAPLQPDALEVLADLDARGITFSLNSMHPHPLLMDILAERELTDRFVAIDGLRVQDTGSMSKTEHLYAHLGAVGDALGRSIADVRNTAVMIGDTVDDAVAATANNVAAIIVTTGETSAERIAMSGYRHRPGLTEAFADVFAARGIRRA